MRIKRQEDKKKLPKEGTRKDYEIKIKNILQIYVNKHPLNEILIPSVNKPELSFLFKV